MTDNNRQNDKPVMKPEEIRSGMVIAIHQKIQEGDKERVQMYEGIVMNVHGGKGMDATMTVRKISDGIGVEKIFPLHLPSIIKIEKIREMKTRRARLNYLRSYKKKLKEKQPV